MTAVQLNVLNKDEILARYRTRRATLLPRLRATMMLQMAKLAEFVRASKLSGQVLRNRTGTLRRSIHPSVEMSEGTVTGTVGTNVSYARVHEDGGVFNVPSHWRTQTQAFGRPIPPRSVNVRSHQVTFPQRAFLRPSLNERRDEIMDALRGTVREVMRAP